MLEHFVHHIIILIITPKISKKYCLHMADVVGGADEFSRGV